MMKTVLFSLFSALLILSSCSSPEQQGIAGLWKSRDQNSDKPRSLVAIYKYKDMYYGRMLATYDENGKIKDTILEKKEKATGVVGNPPYCVMDFVYHLKQEKDDPLKYEGKIIDPEKGKVYTAEVWLDGDNIIVRGKVWIFGENIPWHKAANKDLPSGFSMRDIKDFVPVIPEIL